MYRFLLTLITISGARGPEFTCSIASICATAINAAVPLPTATALPSATDIKVSNNVSRIRAGAMYVAMTFVVTLFTLNKWIKIVVEFWKNIHATLFNEKNRYIACVAVLQSHPP